MMFKDHAAPSIVPTVYDRIRITPERKINFGT